LSRTAAPPPFRQGGLPAPEPNADLTVVGIDVGGRRKGFHAVALSAGRLTGQLASREVEEISHWCRERMGARIIAIDAPCRWSHADQPGPRPCERELLAAGIRCFPSPTRHAALIHPSDYYGWMLQGEVLYQQLESSHPLLAAPPQPGVPLVGPACFETFPHAITWQLRGGNANAAEKRAQRSVLLRQAGIDPAPLTSIDLIDAALCALAAHDAAIGAPCHSYGEPLSGLIVVPLGSPA
jgi:predicted nuclease with RNAse H fold